MDLNAEALAGTATLAAAPGRLSTHEVNVTDAERVRSLVDEVVAEHGQVDGLLNVAGIIQRFVPFVELSHADIERVMGVNFWGVVNMLQAFLPILRTRPAAAVVNVSSMGGFLPVPGQTVYGASKAAVKLLTEGLRAEMRGTNLAVSVVFPGAVGTDITRNSGVSIPGAPNADSAEATHKTTSPKDAAETIIKGMEKGSYRIFVGRDAVMMDALTRLAPLRAMEMISKQMAHLIRPGR